MESVIHPATAPADQPELPLLIVLLGATASGKTELAIARPQISSDLPCE